MVLNRQRVQQLQRWWAGLRLEEQEAFVQLWSAEEPEPMSLGGEPILLLGIEEDPEQEAQEIRDWMDWLEYRYGHGMPMLSMKAPVFHLACTAHPAARRVIAQRYLPANFACPLVQGGCPMRAILRHHGGRSVRLLPVRLSQLEAAQRAA